MSTVTLDRIYGRFARLRPASAVSELVAILLGLLGLGLLAFATARPLAVTVDDLTDTVWTHRRTVAPLLRDLGLALHPDDRLLPQGDSHLILRAPVVLSRARPVRVLADGRDREVVTSAQTAGDVLMAVGIAVDPRDRAVLDGVEVDLDAPLPELVVIEKPGVFDHGYVWDAVERQPLQLRLHRSVPITVVDGGLAFSVRTTAQTVGEALRQEGVTVYLGDRVLPSLGSAVGSGLRVTILRSAPLSVSVDGRQIKTRSQAHTVADALAELGVGVAGLDRVTPPLESEIYDHIRIEVVRVREEVEVSEEIAPFETVFTPDPNLAIDTQQVVDPGAEGITRRRTRVRYENGQEVVRTLEDTWQAQQPAQRVIAYGQRITPQSTVTADGGQVAYWRKISMYATSYSPSRSGVSADSPSFGRTYSGELLRKGAVAVDPRIIPLGSQIYVPGYGFGTALDTGGAVRSRIIDLGYSDNDFVSWSKWVDVYLLWPPPAPGEIAWVIPNWPRPPQ